MPSAPTPLRSRAALLHSLDDISKNQAVAQIERFQLTVNYEQLLVIAIFVRLLTDKASDGHLKIIGELSDEFNRRILRGAFLKLPDIGLRRTIGVRHFLNIRRSSCR